jgi:hypothetical protein
MNTKYWNLLVSIKLTTEWILTAGGNCEGFHNYSSQVTTGGIVKHVHTVVREQIQN